MEKLNARVEKCVKKYGADPKNGLTDEKVAVNRRLYGKNELSAVKGKSLFRRIIDALFDPMLVILEFAGIVTFGVNLGKAIKGGDGNFYECLGILCSVILSVVLTVVTEGKSQKAFEVLNKIYDKSGVRVIRNGKEDYVPKEEIVVGDLIKCESGDKICADAVIVKCSELTVDESTLTGESHPVRKEEGFVGDESTHLSEMKGNLFGGTCITGGNALAIVTAVGDNAEVGKIAGELQKHNTISAPLNEKLDRLGKLVTLIGVVSSIVVFLLSVARLAYTKSLTFESGQKALIEAIVMLVAAVPEGLPTTVAVSLSLSVVKLAKSNALIKKLVAAETVGCVSVICSDKTGTLTENKMTVEKIDGNIKQIFTNACVNSTAEIGVGKQSKEIGNVTERAVLRYFSEQKYDIIKEKNKYFKVGGEAFSSAKKYMTTKVEINGKTVTYIKGAFEKISEFCEFKQGEKQKIALQIESSQNQMKRVLGFAHGEEEGKFVFDGYVVLDDKLRQDVKQSVDECMRAGIDVKILTGDNIATATAVAEKLGLKQQGSLILSADQVERMTDEELKTHLPEIAVIARSTPSTKLRVVKALKELGEVVAVTGDGVNDAPAIKHADIGIAMGSGSEVAKEAGDIVLLDDSFSTIVKAISFGRNVYKNFRSFIMFQLTVNVSAVLVTIITLLLGMPAPFSALQLLWLNIIMDGPPALSLGLQSGDESFMDRKPVKRSDNIVDKKILMRILIHSAVITAIIVLQTLNNFLEISPQSQKTVIFTLFTVFHLINAFNCRETGSRSIFTGLKKNKLMLVVFAVTFAVQVILTQYVKGFFGTCALTFLDWIKILGICLSVVIISEGYKFLYRLQIKRQNLHKQKRFSINEKRIYRIQ